MSSNTTAMLSNFESMRSLAFLGLKPMNRSAWYKSTKTAKIHKYKSTKGTCSSASVGLKPMNRSAWLSSLCVTTPSPSLSNLNGTFYRDGLRANFFCQSRILWWHCPGGEIISNHDVDEVDSVPWASPDHHHHCQTLMVLFMELIEMDLHLWWWFNTLLVKN